MLALCQGFKAVCSVFCKFISHHLNIFELLLKTHTGCINGNKHCLGLLFISGRGGIQFSGLGNLWLRSP